MKITDAILIQETRRELDLKRFASAEDALLWVFQNRGIFNPDRYHRLCLELDPNPIRPLTKPVARNKEFKLARISLWWNNGQYA